MNNVEKVYVMTSFALYNQCFLSPYIPDRHGKNGWMMRCLTALS